MATKKSKELTKKLKKLTTQQRMREAANPEYGSRLLSLLTPTQYAELFPDYFRRGLPDVSGFQKAITKRTQAETQKYYDDIDQKLGTSSPGARERIAREGGTGKGAATSGSGVPNVDNMTASERNFLGLVLKYESGNRNIPNYINDKTHTAQGYFQLTNTNWRNIAPKLGITATSAMEATKEEQTRVALALLRQSGQQNWTSWNAQLRSAVGRGEISQFNVPTTPSSPGGGTPGSPGSSPDFSKFALSQGVDNYTHMCGKGARVMAGHMYGHSAFINNGIGGDGTAGSLSRGNNYFQNSGLFKTGRGIGKDYLTNDYLASLPIGTVISSTGGGRGQGHAQIKVGPNQWASDTVQSHFLSNGYDNFVIHEPNQAGLDKLSANGVIQPSAEVSPVSGGQPQQEQAKTQVTTQPTTGVPTVPPPPSYAPDIPEQQLDFEQSQEQAKTPTSTATVNKPEKQAEGSKTFNVNREALIGAIRQTPQFKEEAGMFAGAVPDDTIWDGFWKHGDTAKLMKETNSSYDAQTGQAKIGNYKKFQEMLGMDTSKILTEIPANTPAHAGGGRHKIHGHAHMTRLRKPHKGDTALVTDSKGDQFTVNPEKETMSINPNTGMMDIRPLGHIGAKYEGAKGGIETVSSGMLRKGKRQVADPGGVSYGAHQLSSRTPGARKQTGGTMGEFLRSNYGKQYADSFKGLNPGTKEFTDVYNQVVAQDKEGFAKAQQAFIDSTHYDPFVKYAQNKGINISNPAIKEAIHSMGVQSRNTSYKFIDRAVESGAQGDEEMIKALFHERSQAIPSQSRRFRNEMADTLAYHNQYQQAQTRVASKQGGTAPGPSDKFAVETATAEPKPASYSDKIKSALGNLGIVPPKAEAEPVIRTKPESIGPAPNATEAELGALREEVSKGNAYDNTKSTPPQKPVTQEKPDIQHQSMMNQLPSIAIDPFKSPTLERAIGRAYFNEGATRDTGNDFTLGNKQ